MLVPLYEYMQNKNSIGASRWGKVMIATVSKI